MTTNKEDDGSGLRGVGVVGDQETGFAVFHVWDTPEDIGMVNARVNGEDQDFAVCLDYKDALVLSELLRRAASLVLEHVEEAPDFSREAQRWSGEQD